MTTRRHGGALTPDERDLWDHVTDHVHPLRRAVQPLAVATPEPNPKRKAQPEPTQPAAAQPKPRWQPLITIATPRPVKPTSVAPVEFDRRKAKKIAAGQVEIEGRIDLHGLRESEAHVRLIGYLRQAQAQGKRMVLVITGKGRDTDDPYAPFDMGGDRAPRGVLKRNVPRWLGEPDLSGIVVSYTTAHTRHGGEGALYVHLRRPRT